MLKKEYTAWKVSKYGVFPGGNTGKYAPEKTPYLDPFYVVVHVHILYKLRWWKFWSRMD